MADPPPIEPLVNDLGANIRELPEDIIEEAVTGWAAKNDIGWIIDEFEIDQSKIFDGIHQALATQLLLARVKEFHAVEVEADVSGLNLHSDWIFDTDLGNYEGDQVTPNRVIPYAGLLDNLIDDIMREDRDVSPQYRDMHRQGLRDLRFFATSVLKALDECPFTGV